MVERYHAYDAFARLYDRHWGPRSQQHLEFLEPHVLGRVPAGGRILDLCCGTGQLAALLGGRGYRVVGLDGSAAMLEHARRNAPDAELFLADAREFRADEPFDAVVSMYDSLNHVMTETDLAAVFLCVAAALVSGGTFAFDLNMGAKFVERWSASFHVVDDDQVGVFRATTDTARRRGLFDATLLYRQADGTWSRDDVHLEQTWYDEATVRRLLEDAGFAAVSTHARETNPDDPQAPFNALFVTHVP